MIDEALDIIANELNAFIGMKVPAYADKAIAVLSDLVNQQGEIVITSNSSRGDSEKDSVIVTLINIEEEAVGKAQLPYFRNADQTLSILNPEIKLNLYVLFAAHSTMGQAERYKRALKLISLVALFFQQRRFFDHENTPNLSPGINKLIVELVSPTFEQQNHLWGTLGAKMMPYLLYRVRLLSIQETDDMLEGPRVETTDSVLGG